MEAVVHLAGANEVHAATDPDAALVGTVVGTRRLVDAAAEAGVKTFVYLSTMHVYGDALMPGAEITEETLPRPRTVYGIARLAAEHLAQSGRDLDVVVLRLANAIGAPAHPEVDRWTPVTNDLCRQLATTGELELRSDGTQWRDFTPLGAVCELLVGAARGKLPPGTYNVASGVPTTIRALAERVQEVAHRCTGRRPPLHIPPASSQPPAPYVVNVDKLSSAGYRMPANVEDAIEETLRFCLAQAEVLCR
jgi:UDP-glucose 4-epimerase